MTTALSDMLFPSRDADLAHNINRILGDLKRANFTITNRLRSIQEDADFVESVADALKRPLVANERCGSWYIQPQRKAASAYFKSTDGHTGQWRFSTRRLNLHLLSVVEKEDGIIIVDSTRRGKTMPDALSKTIPLWCCVLNRALFPDNPEYHNLYTPPTTISPSEHAQMLARIPESLAAFHRLNPDLPSLRAQLSKPLRPTWVTHATTTTDDLASTETDAASSFHPIICCTASRRVVDGELTGHTGYIQGAGDDTENWAHGLTPPIFWAHAADLLATPEADLPDLIASLVLAAPQQQPLTTTTATAADSSAIPSTVRQLTPHLFVSPLPLPGAVVVDDAAAPWCTIALASTPTPPETWVKTPHVCMQVGIGKHKVASRNLRAALPSICDFVTKYLHQEPSPTTQQQQQQPRRVLIACETGGRDLAVGVALALLCWCFEDEEGAEVRRKMVDDDEAAQQQQQPPFFNKTMIKVRLGRIMMAMPDANPNRATLQSVNSFLMDWK